jgi:type I restriction enzyme M protein
LESVRDGDNYSFFVGNLESVGWRAGDKKAVPVYVHETDTGALLLDDANEPVLDADFSSVLGEFLRSPAPDFFPWASVDRTPPRGAQTESIDIREVVSRPDLMLDPKRYSAKYLALRRSIVKSPHLRLGDVFQLVNGNNLRRRPEKIYKYVEIERIGVGEYDYLEQRGWQLPSRAKLSARKGDLFIAHLWSSAGKWFIASSDDLIVTNGCAHLRLREGQAGNLPSVLLGMCSEAFSVQIRAASTGSDGLAEISDEDLIDIRFPLIEDETIVAAVRAHYEEMLSGQERFSQFARQTILAARGYPVPPARKSHVALV